MEFSPEARILATCSWDSTCMLWQILQPTGEATTETIGSILPQLESSAMPLRLVLMQILPVHELGASCARFVCDGRQLITAGDCTIKLWQLTAEPPEDSSPPSGAERAKWEAAIPFSLSVDTSLDLIAFDETLAAFVPHHAWQYQHHAQPNGERDLKLMAPELLLVPPPGGQQQGGQQQPKLQEETDGAKEQDAPRTARSIPAAEDRAQVGDHQEPLDTVDKTDGISATTLSTEDTAFLEQYYRDLTSFDFEQLLNPTIPLRSAGVDASFTLSNGVENQSEHITAAPPSIFTFAAQAPGDASTSTTSTAVAKEFVWTPLQLDANGKLVRTFSERNAKGFFNAHTSRITCCAVATDLDVLVTIALDKALKFWSFSRAHVLETVFEAHTAPITCCALTTQQTRQNSQSDGMLVATGAKDNLIKVWRRNCLSEHPTECIYALTGHYDAPACCVFDSSGVFLVTAGDDTNVIVWRVVPSSPDQPKPLTLVAVDRFEITVSWDVPLANGSPLLHYVVRTTQVSSLAAGGRDVVAIPDTIVPAKYTSKTIEHLLPGIQYTLEIAAVNEVSDARVILTCVGLAC